MRILDVDKDVALKDICLYLTLDEANELLDSLNDFINHSNKIGQHAHICDNEYTHELTISLYDEEKLASFNDRSVLLIKRDI